jgi:hypothetical protein
MHLDERTRALLSEWCEEKKKTREKFLLNELH